MMNKRKLMALAVGRACAEDLPTYTDPFANESTYRRLVDGWAQSLSTAYADVVFIGDSLTYAGHWEEYFPSVIVDNLGVVGDITYGLVMRLPLLEALKPAKCFVMVGVNDLMYHSTVEDTVEMYDRLLTGLEDICE